MFYPSYSDTSSTNSENKPFSANLYLKREKGWSVPIIVGLTKSLNLNPKCLRGQFRFIPLSHNLMLACTDMTS